MAPAGLGLPVQFGGNKSGFYGPIQGLWVGDVAEKNVILCLHCVVDIGQVRVSVNKDGHVIPPLKAPGKLLPLPFVDTSGRRTSKFHVHWNDFHSDAGMRKRMAQARAAKEVRPTKKRRRRGTVGPLDAFVTSDVSSELHQRAVMLRFCSELRMSFREAVSASHIALERGLAADSIVSQRQLRRRLRTDLGHMALQCLGEIREELVSTSVGMAGFTMDGWTAPGGANKFTAITIHFINLRKMSPQCCTIGCIETAGGAAVRIAEAVSAAWARFIKAPVVQPRHASSARSTQEPHGPIQSRLTSIRRCCVAAVVDNATAMVRATEDVFSSHKRLPCLMHTIELVTRSLLRESLDVAERSKRMLTKFGLVMKSAQDVTAAYKRSNSANQKLRRMAEEAGAKFRKFVTPVATRWGSMYDCLERALENLPHLRKAQVEQLLPDRESVQSSLTALSRCEAFAKAAVNVLRVFQVCAESLCKEKTVTISLVVPCLVEMYEACETSASDTPLVRELKFFLREKLVLRFGRPSGRQGSFSRRVGGLHPIFFAATSLDPRTMFSVGGDNYHNCWKRAARHLQSIFRSLHERETAGPSAAPPSSPTTGGAAIPGLVGLDLPRLAPPARTAPVRLGWQHWDFESKLEGLARTTHQEYSAGVVEYRESHQDTDATKKIPVSAIFPNPVQFWVSQRRTSADDSIFHDLFEAAMATLAVPATEASSERVFKAAKYVFSDERPHLEPGCGEDQVIVRRALQRQDLTAVQVGRKLALLSQ